VSGFVLKLAHLIFLNILTDILVVIVLEASVSNLIEGGFSPSIPSFIIESLYYSFLVFLHIKH